MVRRTHAQRGFTLIELMVSLAVFAVVSAVLMEMMVRQSRTYTVVDDVAEAQEKVRAVANLLEQDLRGTGYVVPVQAALCGYDVAAGQADTNPDVVYVTNTEAVLTPPAPPTPVPLAYAPVTVIANVGIGTQVLALHSLRVDAAPFYDLNNDGTADSDFRGPTGLGSPPSQRGGIIVFDPTNPALGTACGQITNIVIPPGIVGPLNTAAVTVDFTSGGTVPGAPLGLGGTPLGGTAGALAAVPAHGYWIGPSGPNNTPSLFRDGIVMSEDVEDLQLAAFFDAGNDGIIGPAPTGNPQPWNDAAEYPGSRAANSWYVSGARNNLDLREIRVTIVARTRGEDPNVNAGAMPIYFAQRPENRVIPGTLVADGFRRRSITMAVVPRNLMMR
jgi:prepilin-type N-terminal cleavage/methylation domain-containing protein